jgi:hypothetical protein
MGSLSLVAEIGGAVTLETLPAPSPLKKNRRKKSVLGLHPPPVIKALKVSTLVKALKEIQIVTAASDNYSRASALAQALNRRAS